VSCIQSLVSNKFVCGLGCAIVTYFPDSLDCCCWHFTVCFCL